jgi:cobalt/nickel transport system permease protein
MLTLDRYIDCQSPVHALDARVKLLLTLGFILALALLPPGAWLATGVAGAALWWAVLRAKVGLGTILGRAFVALPFALVAVTLVFSRPGATLFRLELGPLLLTATDAGLVAFVSVVVKSWLSVQAALLLTATTHFTDLLYALRGLRLPSVLVAILGFAYRYLFILVDEAQRMLRAREVRSAERPGVKAGGSLAWRAGVVGQMVGTLFVRSYAGEVRTLRARPLSSSEQGLLFVGGAALAGLVLLAYVL